MRKRQRDVRLLVRVAQMYYEEGANQSEIAEKLRISKATISRILSEAKEEGIVTVKVHNPISQENIEIEKEMERRFALKEVIIIPSNSQNTLDIKKDLAKVAAGYLERIIKQGQSIGISMGSTLKEIPPYIKNQRSNDFTFIPLLGGIGQINIDLHPNQIAQEFAKKFKGNYKLLHAPAIVENMKAKEAFIKDSHVQAILNMGENVHIGVFGIGSLSNTSTLLKSGYYSNEDIKSLRDRGAVGDISSRFINEKGQGEIFEFNNRVIGLSLEKIKNIPLSVGIAGGEEKAQPILAVLRGGYINVLITDLMAAQRILTLDDRDVSL